MRRAIMLIRAWFRFGSELVQGFFGPKKSEPSRKGLNRAEPGQESGFSVFSKNTEPVRFNSEPG